MNKHLINIPIIDLAPLFDGSQNGLEKVSEAIKSAYTSVGFAYLINHNVPASTCEAIFKTARQFHALPLAEKMHIKQNNCFRGYVPMNASTLKVSTEGVATKPNQLDAFVIGFEPDKDSYDYHKGLYYCGDNQWLEHTPNFKEKMLSYRDSILSLAMTFLKALSMALGMDKNYLDQFFSPPTYWLRLQHYPEQPEKIPTDQFGIAPHSDYGCFTLLLQEDIEGLEVRHPDGYWITVPYLEGSFILNTGDMTRRWSNDTFLSTPHRVVNRSGKERYSVPFFVEPNMHAMIEVLPSCIDDLHPCLFPPIKYGDHFMDRIKGNYGLGKK